MLTILPLHTPGSGSNKRIPKKNSKQKGLLFYCNTYRMLCHSESLSILPMAFNPLALCIKFPQLQNRKPINHISKNYRRIYLFIFYFLTAPIKVSNLDQSSTFFELFFSLTSYLSWHISVSHAPGLTNWQQKITKIRTKFKPNKNPNQ